MTPVGFDSADASLGVTLVAAPGASKIIRVHAAYLSSDTACKLTLSAGSGENAKHRQHVAANGGSIVEAARSLIKGDANTALTITSSVAAAVTGTVWYTIETRA